MENMSAFDEWDYARKTKDSPRKKARRRPEAVLRLVLAQLHVWQQKRQKNILHENVENTSGAAR